MGEYQVLARKYRPQCFKDVLGQEALVTTLKNAIKLSRTAHAYLFCGSRGTGKTTLARLFAKALNCNHLSDEGEPCNQCSACKEITAGNSLDVLEIDGASHRGIDDIRQINDNAGYITPSGKYKIYLIDEVHMLTKEAFNALLKTLEEPPQRVKFLFATTESHKIPATILSRCQKFQLNRLSPQHITHKLTTIAQELEIRVDSDALLLIARAAEGSLRDAESLFDQIISFQGTQISKESVQDVLGLMPREAFFALDQAGKQQRLAAAFELSDQVFSLGKNIPYFVESLIDHFRTLLTFKLGHKEGKSEALSKEEITNYEHSASLYTQEQCLDLIHFLLEAQEQLKSAPSLQIVLEAILLHVLRSHQRLSIDLLVTRLIELENKLASTTPPAAHLSPVSKKPEVLPVEKRVEKELALPSKEQEIVHSSRFDTLMRFASVELEGSLKKVTYPS